MPDRLSIHAPVLVNTIGHCAGAIAFGILLYLFLLDWRSNPRERSFLPAIAAGLALLWNLGSLIGLATSPGEGVSDAIVAASFSFLSVLPAVLLHISLRSGRRILWITGYVVSAFALLLHIGDLITGAPRFHYAALLLVTFGFGTLTAISVLLESLSGKRDGGGARLAAAMVLFLFAISFVHFESAHNARAWSGEVAFHHAGIPLALFVLLQDYRFLLLDAFIRFLVNGLLAAVTVWAAFEADIRFALLQTARHDPFYAGIVFTLACLSLGLFAWARARTQRFLTRTVFLRAGADRSIEQLRDLASASAEAPYLQAASSVIAAFVSAGRFEVIQAENTNRALPEASIAILDPSRRALGEWVRALAPLRFSRGDTHLLLLGSRTGGRRYLSEDIEILDRLSAIATEQVERIRNAEMQELISQAELRALQAQINPHFLFNSLNTLYGVIGRENKRARQLVSNLANLFRYSFAANRGLIRIEEELAIVEAYLEIEQLRLGSRLVVELDIDRSVMPFGIPVLSIQPLVENAVRHGSASQTQSGFVRVEVRRGPETIHVEISNSGPFGAPSTADQHGVGLVNVRRRLALCYGNESQFDVASDEISTTVRFSLPVRSLAAAVHS